MKNLSIGRSTKTGQKMEAENLCHAKLDGQSDHDLELQLDEKLPVYVAMYATKVYVDRSFFETYIKPFPDNDYHPRYGDGFICKTPIEGTKPTGENFLILLNPELVKENELKYYYQKELYSHYCSVSLTDDLYANYKAQVRKNHKYLLTPPEPEYELDPEFFEQLSGVLKKSFQTLFDTKEDN